MPFTPRDRLNYLSSEINLTPLDAQNTTLQQSLREILKDKYTPNAFKGVNFLKGEVLRVEKETTVDKIDTGGYLAGLFGSATTIRSYKIRIPELHSNLLTPTDFGQIVIPAGLAAEEKRQRIINNSIIDLYPTFIEFNPSDPLNASVVAGDIVWCLFMNTNTFDEPYMFKKVIDQVNPATAPFKSNDLVPEYDPKQKNPFSPPGKLPSPPPNNPQGYNGKYIIDYSMMIDFMGSTKGWRYVWGSYDQIANSTRAPFALGSRGVDCAGLVRRWILFSEMVDLKSELVRLPEIGGTISVQLNFTQGQNWRRLFVEIPDGQQLPGDIAVLKYPSGGGHAMVVASYPDTADKHSYVWQSLGSGDDERGNNKYAYVGRRAASGKQIVFGVEKPKRFSSSATITYLRIPWSILPKWFQDRAKSNGVKQDEKNQEIWYFEGEQMAKNWPNQYAYPAKISALPDAVKQAQSLFRLHASEKIIHDDSER